MPNLTWTEFLQHHELQLVPLAWNVSGVEALTRLREAFASIYPKLHDGQLDVVARQVDDQGTDIQLRALGSAMQRLGLRLNYIKNTTEYYPVFVCENQETRCIREEFSELIGRKFFRSIENLELGCKFNEIFHLNPVFDAEYEYIQNKILMRFGSSTETYRYVEPYLIMYRKTTGGVQEDIRHACSVFDLSSWPVKPLKVKKVFSNDNIYPCSLIIEQRRKKVELCGDDWGSLERHEELRYDKTPCSPKPLRALDGVDLSDRVIEKDGLQPMFSWRGRIYYKQVESSVAASDKFLCGRGVVAIDTQTGATQCLDAPNLQFGDTLKVYQRDWVVIEGNGMRGSYVLRFWNLCTNQCLKLQKRHLGRNELVAVFPLGQNDLVLLLEDGRLCHPADLVKFLKTPSEGGNEVWEWKNVS